MRRALPRTIDLNIGFLLLFLMGLVRPSSAAEESPTLALSSSSSSSSSKSEVVELTTQETKSWQWEPEAEHPCNIPRWSWAEVYRRFGSQGVPALHPQPLVIVPDEHHGVIKNATAGAANPVTSLPQQPLTNSSSVQLHEQRNSFFRSITQEQALLEFFGPDFLVTLSSSNSLSEHKRTITLRQHVREMREAVETTPNQRSNESWYLFGETYSADWQRLLDHYQLPPCTTCTRDLVALSFGMGNRGSGVQWHVHGPGFSEAVHGRKHWVLYPPHQEPRYHKDESSRQWMEYRYSTARPKPLECTLNPGDLIYFPDRWWHATINLAPYTVFVSTFTSEHSINYNYDDEF